MQDNENEVVYLYLDDIIPNRFQPRQIFDERALKELAISIREHGVIQPIIVRNIGNKYEIIAGERRYKASALAGLTKIPAIVRNLDDKESSKVALLENLQRKNLNPIEEARTYQKILELDQMTQESLAKTMGKSQSAIANKLRLLSLTDEVQDALLKEQISERHARTLLSISNSEEQIKMLKKVVNNKMTVRELEEEIKPKQELKPEDIDALLKKDPVSINEPVPPHHGIPDISDSTNSNNDFNQGVGIDYSTPPKFIDYGMDDSSNSIADDSLTSTASKPIDLDELRKNAQDINVEKPQADLDNLLKVTKSEEDSSDSGGTTFKFFEPPVVDRTEPLKENKNEPFNSPSILEQPSNSESEPSAFDVLLSSNNSSGEPSSMDSLLNPPTPVETNNNHEDNNIPYLDTYNNPFARNPIFQDDIEKIIGRGENESKKIPNYNFNDCLELIRNTIRDIERSGFKVDSEEMNFEKNYQIVIKIAKKEEEIQK